MFGAYEGRKLHGLIPDPESPGGSLVRKGPADPLTVWRAMRDAFRGAGIPEGVVEAALPPRPEVDRRPDAIASRRRAASRGRDRTQHVVAARLDPRKRSR